MALLRRQRDARSDFFPGFTEVVEIGIGSLASVYRAREIETNRLVALKLLNVRDASPRALESFERESIALGAVSSHPNIVTLYRSFRAGDGRPVLVLELCDGAISDRMRDGHGLPIVEVVGLGIKVAGALETAHRAHILHRDVKPQNILITEFGEPALADFGVAMLQSSTQTTAGLFDFTTLHAAPELLEGGETSAATDVYELASSLYQLVAGRSAFRAYEGESPASVILRILRDPVQPLAANLVPTELSDLLIHAMSKDKAARPPTAAEFAAELARIEQAQGWPSTRFLVRDVRAAPPASAAAMLRPKNAPPVGLAPVEPFAARLPAEPTTPGEPGLPAEPRAWAPPVLAPDSPPRSRSEPTVVVPIPPLTPEHGQWSAVALSAAPDSKTERVELAADWRPLPPPPGPDASAPDAPAPVPQYPIPPAARADPVTEPPVPTWAHRSAEPGASAPPQFVSDLALDPMTLRRRVTLRAGSASMVIDESGLALRQWWRRRQIGWPDVLGFEPHFEGGPGAGGGRLVARTRGGPVELPATQRGMVDLRYVHALLDAYHQRAQLLEQQR